jgi:hypothetical protein
VHPPKLMPRTTGQRDGNELGLAQTPRDALVLARSRALVKPVSGYPESKRSMRACG